MSYVVSIIDSITNAFFSFSLFVEKIPTLHHSLK